MGQVLPEDPPKDLGCQATGSWCLHTVLPCMRLLLTAVFSKSHPYNMPTPNRHHLEERDHHQASSQHHIPFCSVTTFLFLPPLCSSPFLPSILWDNLQNWWNNPTLSQRSSKITPGKGGPLRQWERPCQFWGWCGD